MVAKPVISGIIQMATLMHTQPAMSSRTLSYRSVSRPKGTWRTAFITVRPAMTTPACTLPLPGQSAIISGRKAMVGTIMSTVEKRASRMPTVRRRRSMRPTLRSRPSCEGRSRGLQAGRLRTTSRKATKQSPAIT